MNRATASAAPATLLWLLTGCASTPTLFLTLVPPPGSAQQGTAPAEGPRVSVSIPGQGISRNWSSGGPTARCR